MLVAAAVPGVLLSAGALASPKSPRMLMKIPCRTEAATELGKIRPAVDFTLSFDVIGAVVNRDTGSASWGRYGLRIVPYSDNLTFCLSAASAAWAEFGPTNPRPELIIRGSAGANRADLEEERLIALMDDILGSSARPGY
jgi:hypothetical protein